MVQSKPVKLELRCTSYFLYEVFGIRWSYFLVTYLQHAVWPPQQVVRLQVGGLHSAGWGEGPWELVTSVKAIRVGVGFFKNCCRSHFTKNYFNSFNKPNFLKRVPPECLRTVHPRPRFRKENWLSVQPRRTPDQIGRILTWQELTKDQQEMAAD